MNTAKIFATGGSQAVRLPLEFRFDVDEVFISREPVTGNVVLSKKPSTWDGLFALDASAPVPSDFLSPAERHTGTVDRDPLDGM